VPAPQSPPVPAPSTPLLPSVPRAVRSAASSGGGVILGTLTYVLALTYLRSGRAGVVVWLRAKFLNQTGTLGNAGQGVSSSGGGGWQ
jgi:hypothetical protein